MAELVFDCLDARPDPAAATPTVLLRVRIADTAGGRIYAVALRCQLRAEPQRRRYSDTEAEALQDLFGARSRWGVTLKPFQLGLISTVVPGFNGSTEVDLALPCSYDFDVAANKYLYALETAAVPLLMLFSGSVFEYGPGGVSVQPVPWQAECHFDLPVAAWKETMAQHFPGTSWLRLNLDTFDELHRYRIRHQLVSWDDAVNRLLAEASAPATPDLP